jgi:uncharacterized membrane protein
MGLPTSGTADSRLSESGRVKTFSDGVFAIIITLLVLDLHVPDHEPGKLWDALADRWPAYVAFAVSFLYVGVLWLNHHALFRNVAFMDRGFQYLNLALLFGTVIIPFPTSVIASTFNSDTSNLNDQRNAVLLYSLLAAVMSLTWGGVWMYLARHPELLTEGTDPDWPRAQLPRPATGVILYTVGGLAGWLIRPEIGLLSIVAMIIYHAFTAEGVRRAPDLAA